MVHTCSSTAKWVPRSTCHNKSLAVIDSICAHAADDAVLALQPLVLQATFDVQIALQWPSSRWCSLWR